MNRSLHLLCAFAVAAVTMFHVCDVVGGRAVDVVTAVATVVDEGLSGDTGKIAVEKCHTCAVSSLPAMILTAGSVSAPRVVPGKSVDALVSYIQPLLGPPPRA